MTPGFLQKNGKGYVSQATGKAESMTGMDDGLGRYGGKFRES